MDSPSIDFTVGFVRKLFAGATDKAGEPYWEHCVRVMHLLPSDASDDTKHAALLHDVFEDTHTTAKELERLGYSARTIEIVRALTHSRGEDYRSYIRRLASSADQEAINVKLADNADNANPERLARLDEATRNRLVRKYAKAREILPRLKP